MEKTTIREARKCCATSDGTTVFWIQVSSGAESVPNFCPARYSTLGTCGSFATCAASARSQEIGSMPQATNSAFASGRLNRDTPYTFVACRPTESSARRSITASDVPIFPPTPSTM